MVIGDIGAVLREWPFDPERNTRRIVGDDGKAKVQVRLPLGLEQYELEGRPDGMRPEGEESYLHVYQRRLQEHVGQKGTGEGLALGEEDCRKLREESLLYYFRYLLCFQLGDFVQVMRDTERNMEVFRFVHRWAEREQDRMALEQYWPYIIRLNATARAMQLVQEDNADGAVSAVEEARERIEALEEVPTETFAFEKARSLAVLAQVGKELRGKGSLDEREIVRERLQKAIAEENYERAAQLRDLLRSMGG